MTWGEQIKQSRPEAGRFVCKTCREDPSEECSDYCSMSSIEELPPIWMDYWPECSCCGRPMHLARLLVAAET